MLILEYELGSESNKNREFKYSPFFADDSLYTISIHFDTAGLSTIRLIGYRMEGD